MTHPDALDANLLYPQWLRDLMLTLAVLGYYEPYWSDRIVDEMRRNVLRNHPDIDPARFDGAKVGCPVSQALTLTTITLTANLA